LAGAGYLGPPADGVVEIGYSVVPEARGRGLATEIVQALAVRALAVDGVRKVIAHTLESNTTSQGVLRRAGFNAAGQGAEPGMLRFERARHEAR
jgi:RimJ/RimL family protein N-acetyltransferase